jgi:hypothetical protein
MMLDPRTVEAIGDRHHGITDGIGAQAQVGLRDRAALEALMTRPITPRRRPIRVRSPLSIRLDTSPSARSAVRRTGTRMFSQVLTLD